MKYLPRLGFVWFVAALALSSAAYAGTTVRWNFNQATDFDFLAETPAASSTRSKPSNNKLLIP